MNPKSSSGLPWWKRTTVYQIYPRSFFDSNNDGIGDIPGIIAKLDYLKDLGIETIWFSPFFDSPQRDHGYDVRDYRNIAPEYGTLDDCLRLIREIHDRDMFVVFDMVLNHTSEEHPWFIESRSSRDSPKRDWYIWRDGKKPGGKKPPNNWKSMVGGSGWHYDEKTDQWYWAQFLPFQPDLNYRNPDVKQEMFDVLRFWLDKGVDGFRLDIINTIYEDEQLRDNPFAFKYLPSEEDTRSFFHDNIHTINHPDNFQFVKELRCLMDEYSDPERFLVGEVGAPYEVLKRYCGNPVNDHKTDGLHLTFQFQALNARLDPKSIRKLLFELDSNFPEPYMPTLVFSNHDQMRRISKLGNDVLLAKLNAVLQLTARGVPFIYYGEEIGMLNHDILLKEAQDPIAKKYAWIPRPLLTIITGGGKITLNRDNCRTPMQWDSSKNSGFCTPTATPWLPLEPHHVEINVANEEHDPYSLLTCYKTLLRIRKENPALHSGSMRTHSSEYPHNQIVVYDRVHQNEGKSQLIRVILNLSRDSLQVSLSEQFSMLFSTHDNSFEAGSVKLSLDAFEGVILEAQ